MITGETFNSIEDLNHFIKKLAIKRQDIISLNWSGNICILYYWE